MNSFIDCLLLRSSLTETEQDAMLSLPATEQTILRGRDVRRQGEELAFVALILEGVVGRYSQNRDGYRQFIALHIPGDLPDLQLVVLPETVYGLEALTDVTVAMVLKKDMLRLSREYQGITEAFWRDCAADTMMISQHVVRIANLNARGRIAHLLCEASIRFNLPESKPAEEFFFPLKQSQIGEFLGLTSVHTNRKLRELREMGLARFCNQRATMCDWDGLACMSEFDPGYLSLSL